MRRFTRKLSRRVPSPILRKLHFKRYRILLWVTAIYCFLGSLHFNSGYSTGFFLDGVSGFQVSLPAVKSWHDVTGINRVYAQSSDSSGDSATDGGAADVQLTELGQVTLPPQYVEALQSLLGESRQESTDDEEISTGDGNISAIGQDGDDGLLVLLIGQLDIAFQHTGFMQNSLTDEDLPEVRRHTEHIINILDGENGVVFGDLDRDGQTQNPGDGVGARVYIEEATAQTESMLAASASELEVDIATLEIARQIEDSLPPAADSVNQVLEVGLQVFAADSVVEAQKFGDEVTTLVANALQDAIDARDAAVLLRESALTESSPEVPSVQIEPALLTEMAEQVDIAVQHTSFLQNSLTDEDLPEVRRHAEHIVNVLDGEEGAIFGDLDRDGQEQNPGNGVGMRVYLSQVGEVASAALNQQAEVDGASQDISLGASLDEPLDQLLAAAQTGQDEIQDAFDVALQIFASDTISEAQKFGDELTAVVASIQQRSDQVAAAVAELTETQDEQVQSDEQAQVVLNATTIRAVLDAADEQAQIAVQHTGFLQNALTDEDLPEMRRHTEHIANILDGEDGDLFGDLDRDGQVQNPGNGIGLRFYLDESLRQFPLLAGLLDGASISNEGIESALTAAQAATETRAVIDLALEKAAQIFAVDTIEDGQVIGDELTALVADIQQSVADSSQQLASVAEEANRDANTTEASGQEQSLPIEGILPPPSAIDGDRWINQVDGSTYLFVAPGPVTLGASGDADALPNEEPAHSINLSGFWIQQTETTNQQFAECVDAGVCTPPQNDSWNQPEFANHPVSDVDWQQATDYATWLGARLPTEAEWERACRGIDARIYPWGDSLPTDDLTNFNNTIGETQPVGSYPDGISPVGALDMSGNLYEWTSSLILDYPYDARDGREASDGEGKRVVRGGSYYYTQYQMRCSSRVGFSPEAANAHFGFRLVYDSSQSRWTNPIDQAVYVRIDGGEFDMGSAPDQAVLGNEEPEHSVPIENFWMQQTETTNEQYGRCVDEGVCDAPANEVWNLPEYAQHPVIDLDWHQANTYASWAGGRLPTEAEWEYACRGGTDQTYPWGDIPPSSDLGNYDNLLGETAAIGSYPAGTNPFGLLDLGGNVFEWTSSLNSPYPYTIEDGREEPDVNGRRVIRGGSFFYTELHLRCAARTGLDSTSSNQHVGFRVAVSVLPLK